jgi:hypothetical protein
MQMCIDFTDLNKACPKDPFPLPCINQIVDSTTGCDLLCFLDAFSGYHQIKMAVKDEEKTAFIMTIGCFCYTCMPFGLKNVEPLSSGQYGNASARRSAVTSKLTLTTLL